MVCTSPNQNAPVLAKGYNDCPNHCLKDVSFKKDDFEINRSTGELTILKNQAIYQVRNISVWKYILGAIHILRNALEGGRGVAET